MPTVREIAKHAGVSKTTVSLVLNNQEGVSDELRQRVLDALAEMKQDPKTTVEKRPKLLRTSAPQATEGEPVSVVFLHPKTWTSSEFFRELLKGIQKGADHYQIQLRLSPLSSDTLSHPYFSDAILRPHGVLIIGDYQYEELIQQIRALGILCVSVAAPVDDKTLASVVPDEKRAGYIATNYLLELGHRHIAFIGSDAHATYTRERRAGYLAALADYGLDSGDQLIFLESGGKSTQDCMQLHPDVTAVIYLNNFEAFQGLAFLKEAGYSIPEQLSVVVLDDTENARSFEPPLTAISYPLYKQGYWAIKILMEQLNEQLIENYQVIFGVSLVERESCAPPR